MLNSKVRLYRKNGNVHAAIQLRVSKGQRVTVSQEELLAILLAYKDVVLKDYSDFAAVQHMRETIDLFEKEISERDGYKEVEPEGGLEHIK